MPVGFHEAKLPDADVLGYLYVDPGRPMTIPPEAFTDLSIAGEQVHLRRMVGLMGDEPVQLGVRIEFADEGEARLASDWIAARSAAPTRLGLHGPYISLAWGGEQWASTLLGQWESNAGLTLQERYPEVWEVVQLLPSQPPAAPVAAGFARDLSTGIGLLLEMTGVTTAGLEEALTLVRLKPLAYAVYANDLDTLPVELTGGTLRQMDLGVVAVTRSEYPGFVVGAMLDGIEGGNGLERVKIGSRTFYYRQMAEEIHLMIKNYGSALYLALAPSRDAARQLMEAVMADQGRGSPLPLGRLHDTVHHVSRNLPVVVELRGEGAAAMGDCPE